MSDKSMMEVLVLAILVGVILLLTQEPRTSEVGELAEHSSLTFSQSENRHSNSGEQDNDMPCD